MIELIREPYDINKHGDMVFNRHKIRFYQKSTGRTIEWKDFGDTYWMVGFTDEQRACRWGLDWWAWPRGAMQKMMTCGDLWIEYPSDYYVPSKEACSYVGKSLRYDIMRRDNFACVLCGQGADDGIKLEVDHIHPRSKGGGNEESNLRTLCFDCNRGKRDKIETA
jgi:hypothetical protein